MTTTVAVVLGVATLLGGVAAVWFFWDKISAWLRAVIGLHRYAVRLEAMEVKLTELERHAAVRPADMKFEKELGAYSGIIGGDRIYLCPVCARKDEWVPLQHEAGKTPPWRCPACNKCFPGGGTRMIRPSIG